ncbi:MAG: glycosyltransferase, partial [Chitinophagaceae bacterium]
SCLISIGVMAYNQEKFVRQTMDCILAQQCHYPFEIIIGDDASTDNTRKVLLEYQRKFPNIIKLLPEAPNKGVLKNFRSVIEACTGKYIAFCHCDDYWHDPMKLEKQISFLESNPDIGLVHTDANVFFEKSNVTEPAFHRSHNEVIPDGDVFTAILTGKFFIFTGSACYRKAAVDQYIDFDEFENSGFMYEDLPSWLELSKHVKFKYLDDAMMTYRVVENSHSHPRHKARKFVLMQGHYQMKKHFIDKYNVDKKTALEFELNFHRDKFNIAYNLDNYKEADDSFRFLQQQHQAGMKMRLKRTLLRFPFIHQSLKKLKKAYKPKKQAAVTH